MNAVAPDPEPRLAPPGAGLPFLELLIARLRFWSYRHGKTAEELMARFDAEEKRILALMAPLAAEEAGRRVLIPRPRGLEDSSRFWSVWMTLDHLRIVNSRVARVIGVLGKGKSLPGQSNTAEVKPDPAVGPEVVAEFQGVGEDLRQTVAAVRDWRGSSRFAHSWFGPLDALGWLAMASMHMGLHRVQVERIVAGLR